MMMRPALYPLLSALALAACSTAPSPGNLPTAQARQPQPLPEALRRSAYDAPDWGVVDPATLRPAVATAATQPERMATSSSITYTEVPYTPVPVEEVAARTEPQRLAYAEDGPAVVPPAPQLPQRGYRPRADFAALEPILVTDSRGKMTAHAADGHAGAKPVRAVGNPAPAPAMGAKSAEFVGQTVSVMPAASASARSAELAPAVAPRPQPVARQMSGGGYGIHLASYHETATAQAGWELLRDRHADLFGGLDARGAQVTIPQKGDFIRLLVGPFDIEADAEAVCAQLKAREEYCTIRAFEGRPIS
jgi:hypothetical protein